MKNLATASVPLLIALVGGSTLDVSGVENLRVQLARPAVAWVAPPEALDDEQLGWLEEHNPFGMPTTEMPGNRTLIVREGYALEHNNVDLISDWVAYHLTREYVQGTEARPGSSAFKPDPLLPAGQRAELTDYRGWSGVYDRGHQCANADSRGRGVQVVRESFLLSNMTPQTSRLNQQSWRLLEERIQNLAAARGELWVITGPVFLDDDNDGIVRYFSIGLNHVAVPTHYYKVVVAERSGDGGLEAMAFLIPNEAIEATFEDYLTSIDEIERLTGYDFLENLPDEQEEALESAVAEQLLS